MKQKSRDAIHRVLKIKITIICIALAYTTLSAQSKGFTDTVILKNGTVLNGVKAVVTKDSLVVTTSEGETSIFTKKEVSEVKKGGGGNGEKPVKTDVKSTTTQDLREGSYHGRMNWEDGKAKCASLEMRLPTIEELKGLTTGSSIGIESWEDGTYYWSSTLSSNGRPYYFDFNSNGSYDNFRLFNPHVRCIR
jgi:hypothetical protein